VLCGGEEEEKEVKWFGKDWGAPCCRALEWVETPVGRRCSKCGRQIRRGDSGLLRGGGDYVWHVECFVRCVYPDGETGTIYHRAKENQ